MILRSILLFSLINVVIQAETQTQDLPLPNNQEHTTQENATKMVDQLIERHNAQLKASFVLNNAQKTADLDNPILKPKHEKLEPELRSLILRMASNDIKGLVTDIKNYKQGSRNVQPPLELRTLFVGAPGIGKTTLVQAIAEEADVDFLLINAPFIADKYKNSGAENLKELFKDLLNTTKFTIVAVDELRCLIDSVRNIHNSDSPAEALWTMLDQFQKNPNILFVGILNDPKMVDPLKSRFQGHVYNIKSEDENKDKQLILHYYLGKWPTACNQKCEQNIAKLIKEAEARTIKSIVELAARKASREKEAWQISENNLKDSIKKIQEDGKLLTDGNDQQKVPFLQKFAWAGSGAGGFGVGLYYGTMGLAKVLQLAQAGIAAYHGDMAQAAEALKDVASPPK